MVLAQVNHIKLQHHLGSLQHWPQLILSKPVSQISEYQVTYSLGKISYEVVKFSKAGIIRSPRQVRGCCPVHTLGDSQKWTTHYCICCFVTDLPDSLDTLLLLFADDVKMVTWCVQNACFQISHVATWSLPIAFAKGIYRSVDITSKAWRPYRHPSEQYILRPLTLTVFQVLPYFISYLCPLRLTIINRYHYWAHVLHFSVTSKMLCKVLTSCTSCQICAWPRLCILEPINACQV